MRLLLDTHILIWLATDRERLSASERTALTSPSSELLVSIISLWELRAKARAERRRGRADLPLDPATAIAFCAAAEIAIDPLQIADASATLAADPEHGDPFDEMLLVHAQRLGARLLTRDEKLRGHPLAYLP